MGSKKPLPYREEFEKHGETGTRFAFAEREGDVGRAANAWLAEQQSKREEEASAKRDVREERTLTIAEEANLIAASALSISKLANKIAIFAAIWAAAATIFAAIISSK